jgi:enterochelin esterase-like enzyme
MPVMYLHDGGEYLSRARLPVVLDNLINTGEVASLITVMVDPVNRMTEYRMNGAYADFVASELLPHIDGGFRTLASAAGRGVMRASLGGLISVYLTLTRPDLFSRTASQSGAFLLAEEPILTLARDARATQSFYFGVDVAQELQAQAPGGRLSRLTTPATRRLTSTASAAATRLINRPPTPKRSWRRRARARKRSCATRPTR